VDETVSRDAEGHYAALAGRFPLDALGRDYAASVATLWALWRAAAEDLEDAQRRRREGRGRRPSRAMILRHQRQMGRAWLLYDPALRRLEELAAERKNGQGAGSPAEDLMERLRRAPILSPSGNDDGGGA
jgi:hypothetical protein